MHFVLGFAYLTIDCDNKQWDIKMYSYFLFHNYSWCN